MTTQKFEEKISPSTSQPTTVRHWGPLDIQPGQSRSEAITDLIKHLKEGFDDVDVKKPTYDELLLRTYSLEEELKDAKDLRTRTLEHFRDQSLDLEATQKDLQETYQKLEVLEGKLTHEQLRYRYVKSRFRGDLT